MAVPTASFRDPIHGLIRADPLETALIGTHPLQRLRRIRQLGLANLVFPAAEHSRFSHAIGAMHLAGRVYDALAAAAPDRLDPDPRGRERRLVRAAALLHDIGHAPFSHTAEELFANGLTHEEMTLRILALPAIGSVFEVEGNGISVADVAAVLAGTAPSTIGPLLAQIVAGELDVDKMDYLLRDSLFCGVRYGSYDLERLIDTLLPLADPETGVWGLGVDEGGVHALEALIMARYYMFTQVYFNVVSKAFELHLNRYLEAEGVRWPGDPTAFLLLDDTAVVTRLQHSTSPHARAVVERWHWALAYETAEHLSPGERARFESLLPQLTARFGEDQLMVSNSAKDPHRLGAARVFVRRFDGDLEPMETASHFIGHLARIERYRLYAPPKRASDVRTAMRELLAG